MKWHLRTYTDPTTGEVVSRYISIDGENWMLAFNTEEVDSREDARRSVASSTDPHTVDDQGASGP